MAGGGKERFALIILEVLERDWNLWCGLWNFSNEQLQLGIMASLNSNSQISLVGIVRESGLIIVEVLERDWNLGCGLWSRGCGLGNHSNEQLQLGKWASLNSNSPVSLVGVVRERIRRSLDDNLGGVGGILNLCLGGTKVKLNLKTLTKTITCFTGVVTESWTLIYHV